MNDGDFFTLPIPSRQLHCYEVWNLSFLNSWPLREVIGKAFKVPSFEIITPEKPQSYVASLLLSNDCIL